MIYLIVKAYKRVKEEGKTELSGAIQALVIKHRVEGGNMQVEMERNCLQGLGRFIDAINVDEKDEVLQYFISPCDTQEPVWT